MRRTRVGLLLAAFLISFSGLAQDLEQQKIQRLQNEFDKVVPEYRKKRIAGGLVLAGIGAASTGYGVHLMARAEPSRGLGGFYAGIGAVYGLLAWHSLHGPGPSERFYADFSSIRSSESEKLRLGEDFLRDTAETERKSRKIGAYIGTIVGPLIALPYALTRNSRYAGHAVMGGVLLGIGIVSFVIKAPSEQALENYTAGSLSMSPRFEIFPSWDKGPGLFAKFRF